MHFLASDIVLAYIDPGTGAFILQIVIAAILTAGVAFRRLLVAPVTFFTRKSCKAVATTDQPESTASTTDQPESTASTADSQVRE
jgi:hypothetical protein